MISELFTPEMLTRAIESGAITCLIVSGLSGFFLLLYDLASWCVELVWENAE